MLEDLANRRNQVSHGVDSDILEYEVLQDYVTYVYYFGICIFRVTYKHLIRNFIKNKGKKLGTPLHVYKNGRVACISLNSGSISIGAKIIAHNTSSTKICNILQIKMNGETKPRFYTEDTIEIGIFLDKKISKKHVLYLYDSKIP